MKKSIVPALLLAALAAGPVLAGQDALRQEAEGFCNSWADDEGFKGKERAEFVSGCVAEELGSDEVLDTNFALKNSGEDWIPVADSGAEVDIDLDSDVDAEFAE